MHRLKTNLKKQSNISTLSASFCILGVLLWLAWIVFWLTQPPPAKPANWLEAIDVGIVVVKISSLARQTKPVLARATVNTVSTCSPASRKSGCKPTYWLESARLPNRTIVQFGYCRIEAAYSKHCDALDGERWMVQLTSHRPK